MSRNDPLGKRLQRRASLKRLLLAALAPTALFASGFAAAQPAPTNPLRVVASFSILADMVREIGGNAVEVTSLVAPDSDAHIFEPSPADAQRLARADLVVVNGLGFEGWMERLVRASGYRGALVVASKGVTPRTLGKQVDPHAWQNLANAAIYADNIRDGLIAKLPAQRAPIEQRAAAYRSRIETLDRLTHARFNELPAERRRVITSHDAFGYFGDAYQVRFIAPLSWNTDSEASASDVARLIRQIKGDAVSALFVENITDPRLLRRIAGEAGVKVGGTLYSDALSSASGPASTYLDLMAHNADTLRAAMQPPSGR
ncbi:MAG: putative metal transporter, metal-binding protein [Rhizobacter sp.]|nr:putative metal transporter, metal-binding protein [Rhizobacter sp.]